MNSRNCDQMQSMLLDYIEDEMPLEDSKRVAEHLAECDLCNKEYKGLRAMLSKAKDLSYDDPGEEFWQQLPIKVLQDVQQEKSRLAANNVVDFKAKQVLTRKNASAKTGFDSNDTVDGANPLSGKYLSSKPNSDVVRDNSNPKLHRFFAAVGIAATLLLVINVIVFSPKNGILWFDQTQFQASIKSDKTLSILAQRVGSISESSRMGFIDQQRYDRAFQIGSLLAESFAYLQSSDQARLLERLQHLHELLQNNRVSAVTISSIRKVIESLQATLQTTLHTTDRKTIAVKKLMVTFQGDYENYLVRTAPQQLALFRAGIWLYNAGLAVAAKDVKAVKQLNRKQQLQYLQNAFNRMNAPIGVQKSLEEFASIVSQPSLTNKDFRRLQQSVRNLRALMG